VTLDDWIRWALQPHKRWHPFPSTVLVRQAARDLGTSIAHEDFNTAMHAAGFKIARRSGNAIFWGARDTVEKRRYFRRKFLAADDTVVHPLTP
jgi:hypothetical protein